MGTRASLTFAVAMAAAAAAIAADDDKGDLRVFVSGFQSDKSKAVLLLYRSDDGFCRDEEKAFRRVSAPIKDRSASFTLHDLAAGEYAIWVFHDANDNGKLDRGFLGIPKEGVGASNNARGHMGPPKYKDARFNWDGKTRDLKIELMYP